MVTAEQEGLLGQSYREEEPTTDKQRPRWLIGLIIAAAVIGVVAVLGGIALAASIFIVRPTSSQTFSDVQPEYGPPPIEYYGEPFGQNTNGIAIVQQTPDAVFGGLFALDAMYVRAQEYDPNSPGDVVLLWEVQQPLDNPRYTITVDLSDAQQTDFPIYQSDAVDVGFPLEQGTTLATEFSFGPGMGGDLRYSVTVTDRNTNERLLLANGSDSLTLNLQPAVTIPSQLVVPEGDPTQPGATATPSP